jgi:hypothetical protein
MGSDDEGKCKRALEERNQARLMALNRHKKKQKKIREIKEESETKYAENRRKLQQERTKELLPRCKEI